MDSRPRDRGTRDEIGVTEFVSDHTSSVGTHPVETHPDGLGWGVVLVVKGCTTHRYQSVREGTWTTLRSKKTLLVGTMTTREGFQT